MTNPLSKWFKVPTLAERLRSQGVREDIVAAAERTAFARQSDRGLPKLASMLDDTEAVLQLVEGRYAKATGLLMLTSRRLLFAPAAADRATPTSIELVDVLKVDSRRHRGMGVLEVIATPDEMVVDQILGNQADTMAESLREAMKSGSSTAAAGRDPLEELAELRILHRAGAIGEAEFQIRKQQLFGQI